MDKKTENPFAIKKVADHVSHGIVEIESQRAIAEAQAKVIVAKKFPRNKEMCFENIIEACKVPALANSAFYSYPRGGSIVRGATIRLAEELAGLWENILYGIQELARREGETEMQAFAWDLETNVYSSVHFTVKHRLDTREGSKHLNTDRDIRDLTANIAARKLRGRILAVLPEAVVSAAVDACYDTLAKQIGADIQAERQAIIAKFRDIGITDKAVIERFNVKSVDYLSAKNIAQLKSIYKTIQAGEASAHDIFVLKLSSAEIKKRNQNKPNVKPVAPETPDITEPAEKPDKKIRKGTVAWYKKEIERFGGTVPPEKTLAALQEIYADYLQREMESRQKQTSEETIKTSEQKKEVLKPAQSKADPISNDNEDDDLLGDSLFDED
jgi:hypothetical protein